MISVCLLHLNATPVNSIALITLLCVLLGSATITGSWQCSRSLSLFSPHVATPTIPPLGSFFNYINQILPNIDNQPTPCWHWWRNCITDISENLHTVDISSATYLPRLVNVVKERPLTVIPVAWLLLRGPEMSCAFIFESKKLKWRIEGL